MMGPYTADFPVPIVRYRPYHDFFMWKVFFAQFFLDMYNTMCCLCILWCASVWKAYKKSSSRVELNQLRIICTVLGMYHTGLTCRDYVTDFCITGICGKSTGQLKISFQNASSAAIICVLRVNSSKLWSRQSSCRWFETPWRSCDGIVVLIIDNVKHHTLQWHHNERHDVSNHQELDGLFSFLFKLT